MKRLLFFVNPNAGHMEIRATLMDVLQVFSNAGYEVTVYLTTGPRDLTKQLIARGSAYDLGRDAIHAAYGDFDGSAEKTLLRTLLEEAENGTMDELLGGFYKGGKRKIASYAPLVFEAADAGDRIAEEIIMRNVGVAAGLLDAAAEQFPNGAEIPVVIAGGVTKEQTLLPRLNSQLTDKRLRVQILDTEPVDGAVLLARRIYPPRTEA